MSPSRDFECVRTHIRISELFTIYLFIEHYIKWKKFQDSSPFVRYNKRLSQQCFLGLTKCTVTIIEVINYILFVGLFLAYRLLLVSLTVYLTSLLLLFFLFLSTGYKNKIKYRRICRRVVYRHNNRVPLGCLDNMGHLPGNQLSWFQHRHAHPHTWMLCKRHVHVAPALWHGL